MRHSLTSEERSRGRRKFKGDKCVLQACNRPRRKQGGNWGLCNAHAQRYKRNKSVVDYWECVEIGPNRKAGEQEGTVRLQIMKAVRDGQTMEGRRAKDSQIARRPESRSSRQGGARRSSSDLSPRNQDEGEASSMANGSNATG